MPSPRRPASRWSAALIVLCSFVLRVFRLGDANFWWDEALAIWAVRKGLAGVTAWTAADVHPPLYFWMLWGWVQLVGESALASRLLSVVFGVLTVIVVYRLGRRLGGERLGLLAAFLTSFSRFHVWWSQELRMYVLAGLLGTLSIHHLLGWLRAEAGVEEESPKTRWRLLAGTALYGLGSLYTVLIMVGLVLVKNLVALGYVLWGDVRHRLQTLGRWVAAQLGVIVGLAAWFAYSWGTMSTWSVAEPFGWGRAARLYATLLTTGISVEIERYSWQVAVPMAALLVGGVVGLARWRARGCPRAEAWDVLTLTLVAIVPPILVYLATLPRAIFYTPRLEARYLLPFAPTFWVLLAWALDALIERWRAVGWACAASVAAIWLSVLPGHYATRYFTDELQSMVRTIASQSREGDIVLLNSGTRYPIWSYYYDGLDWLTPKPPVVLLGDDSRILTDERVASELPEMVAGADRVWLAEVDIGLTDPDRLVPTWLEERYPEVQALGFGTNTLRLYDPEGNRPRLAEAYVPESPLTCEGSGYRLRGVDLPVPVVSADGVTQVGLLWEQAPASARLVIQDTHGHLFLARSLRVEGVSVPWRQQVALAIPPEMPGGSYALILELPDALTCELPRLRVVGHAGPRVTAEPTVPLGATLGGVAELVGYTLYHGARPVAGGGEVSMTAGDTVVLDLYWQARRQSDSSYIVFTQLLGQAFNPRTEGPVWGQHDSAPAGYAAPTDVWRASDRILDRHVLVVDAEAPPGLYQLQVGMYDPATGRRLPVTGVTSEEMGDRLLLPLTVRVRG